MTQAVAVAVAADAAVVVVEEEDVAVARWKQCWSCCSWKNRSNLPKKDI